MFSGRIFGVKIGKIGNQCFIEKKEKKTIDYDVSSISSKYKPQPCQRHAHIPLQRDGLRNDPLLD